MVVSGSEAVAKEAPPIIETLLNIIPINPINALASGNVLQIIFFALGLGFALTLIGDKAKPAISVFESLAEGMYKLTELVMQLAPYGVFGLMAWVSGKYGLTILLPLIKLIALVYIGCVLHVLVVYSGLLAVVGQLSPIRYLKGVVNPAIIAFTTTSSSGTLPTTLKASQEELGVSKSISSFVLPLEVDVVRPFNQLMPVCLVLP
jgi:Na+/H+-dicarboxylate symporter